MSDQTAFFGLADTASIRAGFHTAIRRATATLGATAPNPSVGCVLLDAHGEILSVGVHPGAGEPHAEAMALAQARNTGTLDRTRIALVTLEPCNHTGRTPPCTEALLESPVRQVWIGATDPNPQAAGGTERLRQALGEKHVIMLPDRPDMTDLATDCAALLAPFASRVIRNRPWLSVKQALDQQGSMIPPAGTTTFTSAASLKLAHRLRRACDAIVTGAGTVLADRPRFTVRHVSDHARRGPRVLAVCDRRARLPESWRIAMKDAGFDVLICRDLQSLPELLAARGVNWALIEAGPTLLKAVSATGLWDDWLSIHKGAKADRIELKSKAEAESPLRLLREKTCSPVS